MARSHFFLPVMFTSFLISGCATIQLQDAQASKVRVNVNIIQQEDETKVDVQLKQGLWGQPVSLADGDAYLLSGDNVTTVLVKSNKEGRYGYRGQVLENLKTLNIATLGSVEFPDITPVILTGQEQFAGQTFTEDDLLTLSLESTEATERYLITEGLCSKYVYRTEKEISTQSVELELELHDIMRKLNRAAQANLTGIIPVTLRIEERYNTQWPAPFIAKNITAADEASFAVDTVDFRFQAKVGIKLSDNFFFTLATDNLSDKYCH